MAYSITDLCIGCTICSKNCPVNAIEGSLKQVHKINPKRCVSCGVCANVCPKAAILDDEAKVTVKLPKEKWKKPQIDSKLCSACSMCVSVCRFDCLAISMPQFKGDLKVYATLVKPKSCVGCALCAETCPLNAIVMKEVPVSE